MSLQTSLPPRSSAPTTKTVQPAAKATMLIPPFGSYTPKISKSMLSELLLIVSVLGSTTTLPDGSSVFVPVPDCLSWLQDLQRALRGDNDDIRLHALQLSSWSVLRDKLLPLSLSRSDDPETLETVCKLGVILTKPMTAAALRAGMLRIDTKSGKVNAATVAAQREVSGGGVGRERLLF